MKRIVMSVLACGLIAVAFSSAPVSASSSSSSTMPPPAEWSWKVMPFMGKTAVTMKVEVPNWRIAHGLTKYHVTLRNGKTKHNKWFNKKINKLVYIQGQSTSLDDDAYLKTRFNAQGFRKSSNDMVNIRCVIYDPFGTKISSDSVVLQ